MAEGSVPAPYALALVVCDNLHRDFGTGKVTILSTFSNMISRTFPFTHPIICVYAALTSGRGKGKLKIVLSDVDDEGPVLREMFCDVDFVDPIAVLEVCVGMPMIQFPSPGDYRLQIYFEETFLMERRIIVLDGNKLNELNNNPG